MKNKPVLKTCEKGHKFYKSTDCPSCPTCDAENKPESGFLSLLSSPARNALIHEGITTLEKLAGFTEKEILSIHGIGPASLPALKSVLKEKNIQFKRS
jgi:DNA-directed RNA polymerase alpha subunit